MKNIINYINSYDGKIIFVTSSVYNTMLATIILLQTNKISDSIILMTSPHRNDVNQFIFFSGRMNQYHIKNIVIDKKTILHRALGISTLKNNRIKKEVYKRINTKKHEFLLVNFSWAQKKVAYPASIYLNECEKAIFVQEGAMQFATPDENKVILFLKRIYGNQTNFWKMDKIEVIYVNSPENYSKHLQKKLLKFDFNNFGEGSYKEIVEVICDIFLSDSDKQEIINILKTDGIIFTQPLSEDGFTTETEKKDIYVNIMRVCKKYGEFMIKLHPRDTSIYDFSPDILINGKYPSEIYKLLNIRFKYAVGICTSAIATIDADCAININANYLYDKRLDISNLDKKMKEFDENKPIVIQY